MSLLQRFRTSWRASTTPVLGSLAELERAVLAARSTAELSALWSRVPGESDWRPAAARYLATCAPILDVPLARRLLRAEPETASHLALSAQAGPEVVSLALEWVLEHREKIGNVWMTQWERGFGDHLVRELARQGRLPAAHPVLERVREDFRHFPALHDKRATAFSLPSLPLEDIEQALGTLTERQDPRDEEAEAHLREEAIRRGGVNELRAHWTRLTALDLERAGRLVGELSAPQAQSLTGEDLLPLLSSSSQQVRLAALRVSALVSPSLPAPPAAQESSPVAPRR